MSEKMNAAQKRMWDDDPVLTVVDKNNLPDADVRFSDEALDIPRDQGTAAYEKYIADNSST